MGTTQTPTKEYFRFQKVEDYFRSASDWDWIARMTAYQWDMGKQTLTLKLESKAGTECAMLVQIVTGSVLRFRFHPEKTSADDYPEGNTRTVVLDTFQQLAEKNRTEEFGAQVQEIPGKAVVLTFHGSLESRIMKVQASYDPFTIAVFMNEDDKGDRLLVQTSEQGLKFTPAGGFHDYHIIQGIQKPATEKYVGFGEQGGLNLIKNNNQVTYFNYDNMCYEQVYGKGPLEEREPLYHSDPFFMGVGADVGSRAYGVFVDNPSEVLVDTARIHSDECMFGIRYGVLDYYILAGDNCADIIKSFSNIVGTARLIPRYALGYHQGCYGYEKRADIEQVVDAYRANQIPLDGIHVDVDLQDGYKTFTVNESAFPDPAGMFAGLRAKGVKCSTNITPIISNKNADNYSTYQEGVQNGYFVADKRYDPDNPDGRTYYKYAAGQEYEYPFNDKEGQYNTGKPFIGEVYYGNDASGNELGTTGHYPDLNRSEVRIWWGKQYQHLFDLGLEMVWQDMTTPCLRDTRGDMLSFPSRLYLDNDFIKNQDSYDPVPVMRICNLYSYNLHKATYHGLNNLKGRENKRNFIIGRGCFTGMQRFAGLWTGDNASTWDFLKINVSQVLALGLTGQALSGQDIGGFEPNGDEQWADPEILIRWTAMGAFLPWFRNHYIRKGRKLFQEPYEYQNYKDRVPQDVQYLYDCVLPVCRYYISLRYTLLQLFYDAMFENTLDGMPICRALFLTNPDDPALFYDKQEFLNNEFTVRNDLLVAPVLEKETTLNGVRSGKRDVYLPAGCKWYQFTNFKDPLRPAIEGGTTICDFDATINQEQGHIPYIVPMYVREGAVIPTLELEQYVGELNANGKPNPLTIYIYPGQSGSYTMYLDDGVSRSSQPEGDPAYGADPLAKGEYREVEISHCRTSAAQRTVSVKTIHNGYTPKYEKYMILGILLENGERVKEIYLNGEKVYNIVSGGTLYQLKMTPGINWLFNSTCGGAYIKLPMDQENMELTIIYEEA